MTTAQIILTDAINRAIENDAGDSEIARDQEGEGLRVLNRYIQRIYALAADPASWGAQPYFLTTGSLTLGSPATTFVALPTTPRVARLVQVTTATGASVAIHTGPDARRQLLDFPPGIILQDQRVRVPGPPFRVGDPVAADALTLDYAYYPADLATLEQVIGAIDAGDPDSPWPAAAGDPFLIDLMARYYCIKDDAARADLGPLGEDIQADAETLAGVFGINAASLVQLSDA